MADRIVETRFQVSGVRTDADVRRALQSLFDIFAASQIGQAGFEITGEGPAVLIVKHAAHVKPDLEAIARALASAGDYRLM